MWAVLQYLLGLGELGHAVHFVEQLDPVVGDDLAAGRVSPQARYAAQALSAAGLDGKWSFIDHVAKTSMPRPYRDLVKGAGMADVLINISGHLSADDLVRPVPIRVYVDVDPAFTQLWHEVEGIDMGLDRHNRHVTLGASVGHEGGRVPGCGLHWIHSLPPVALSRWPAAVPTNNGAVTSVGNWRSYGSIEHGGKHYGQRAHSLRGLLGLPARCRDPIVMALAIDSAERRDVEMLRDDGWILADPEVVAGTPGSYRAFVRRSKAELCVAKSGYVKSNSGWFSDRSACYLASGRPVVAQDTGFSAVLPAGVGLLAFGSVEEAAEGLAEVSADYSRHSVAARRIALEHLDARIVLASLLEKVGVVV